MKLSPSDIAANVIAKAKEYNFNVSCGGTVLSVRKRFTPGDKMAYTCAESEANTLLGMVPRTEPGSTWGTDGGSVGGAIGLQGGYMELNRSGCSKRVIKAIQKLQGF